MKILLQTNKRPQQQLLHEFKKLEESGFEIIPFGYILGNPRTEEGLFGSLPPILNLTGLENVDLDNDQYVVRCGIQLMKLGFNSSTIVDQRFYKSICYPSKAFETMHIPESLAFLNKHPGDYFFTPFVNIADVKFDTSVFIKPVNDLKGFEGFIIPPGTTVREHYANKESNFLTENMLLPVHVSRNVETINEEVRCYVVNKKVVTVSRYRFKGQHDMNPLPPKREQEYIAYAQRVIDAIYAPCDNFTIDICVVGEKNTFQVVEYNCLTASGLYECNSNKLFTALKEYYYGQ